MAKPHEILAAIPDTVKVVADVASWGIVIGAIAEALPSVAAALSILWLAWQMYDRWKYGPKVLRSGKEEQA